EVIGAGIAGLEEIRVKRPQQWNIRSIEPYDALVALVDVSMPAHRRREDQVALAHVAAPAIDDRRRAVGAGGKADGGEGMTVRAGAIAGIEHGKGRDQVAGGDGLAPERGIDQNKRAALDVVDRDLAN